MTQAEEQHDWSPDGVESSVLLGLGLNGGQLCLLVVNKRWCPMSLGVRQKPAEPQRQCPGSVFYPRQ